MPNKLQETLRSLSELAESNDHINVAFSGGKDSLAVMELCCRTFKKVSAFHFFIVPNTSLIGRYLDLARTRWNVEVAQLPSDSFCMALRDGLFCNPAPAFEGYKERSLKEVYQHCLFAMNGTTEGLVATGMKNSDGLKRRQFFANIDPANGGNDFWKQVHHPLKHWSKAEVLQLLKDSNIPIPAAAKGAVTTGIGLGHDELCFVHDHAPEDFAVIRAWFPYVDAVIKRREWHALD
jgi:phosphoadenosine phosphosulfate reductase